MAMTDKTILQSLNITDIIRFFHSSNLTFEQDDMFRIDLLIIGVVETTSVNDGCATIF